MADSRYPVAVLAVALGALVFGTAFLGGLQAGSVSAAPDGAIDALQQADPF